MEIITTSPQETKELGARISSSLKGGEVFALTGDLGSGKTTFIQGFASTFGIDRIISPSFILMKKYEIHVSRRINIRNLYHLDLYRLEGDIERQVMDLGVGDFWSNKGSIFLIEWADKATGIYPPNTVWLNFEYIDENKRKIIGEKI